jgi:acyl-CoA thioesterase-2
MWNGDETKCFLDYAHRLEETKPDHFVDPPGADGGRGPAFGGNTLARAVLAALRTCEGKHLHSLHARFLRPVPVEEPVEYRVQRLKDGRRLAHRRIEIALGERLLVDVSTCHADTPETIEYQEARIDPDLPPPEDLPSESTRARDEGWDDYEPGDLEMRWPDPTPGPDASTRWSMWARATTALSDTPAHHQSALAWLSDVHSDLPVGQKLSDDFPRERFLSLEHAIWFHRPARWDDWLAVCSHSPISHASRALTQREIFTREGLLLASVSQEAFLS